MRTPQMVAAGVDIPVHVINSAGNMGTSSASRGKPFLYVMTFMTIFLPFLRAYHHLLKEKFNGNYHHQGWDRDLL
jgi:hypothetical protein